MINLIRCLCISLHIYAYLRVSLYILHIPLYLHIAWCALVRLCISFYIFVYDCIYIYIQLNTRTSYILVDVGTSLSVTAYPCVSLYFHPCIWAHILAYVCVSLYILFYPSTSLCLLTYSCSSDDTLAYLWITYTIIVYIAVYP